jgi:protein-S-isoprenylcysteine O-methyltransferase Ste14
LNRSYLKNNLLPALAWIGLCFAFSPGRWDWVGALMIFRCALVVLCFLVRAKSTQATSISRTWISRAAALLPIGILYSIDGDGMSAIGAGLIILGTSLVCLSLIDLGKSFGVSPAVRPYVASGVYRFLPHPMYLGHVLTEAGMFAVTPTLRNGVIIGVSWTFYWIRTRWEAELIADYLSSSDHIVTKKITAHAALEV